MHLHIVVLAAGMGKRMHSTKPKVLQTIAGKPMLSHVVETAEMLSPEAVHIVYGHGGEVVREAMGGEHMNWVMQDKQLGTGHAVLQAMPHIPDNAQVLVLYGDVPLISRESLKALVECSTKNHSLALLVATLPNPFGLGRIVRNDHGDVLRIVEERDASPEEKAIAEIYSGICSAPASALKRWLPMLQNHNSQQEYYFTDIIAMACQEGTMPKAVSTEKLYEIQGVNDRAQQAELERVFQLAQAKELMQAGLQLADPARFDLRGQLSFGRDVFIDANCLFEGNVVLEDDIIIEPNCHIRDTHIASGSRIKANSIIEKSQIGSNCDIGPFARLRANTVLAEGCKIGNFVETKNATLKSASKANHLSYLGDIEVGHKVNIGAGTITCNYDGANKHKTIIDDDAFIGSGSQLVAPITVGAGATIGAGSTLRKSAPAGQLTLSEKIQKTVAHWRRPKKKL